MFLTPFRIRAFLTHLILSIAVALCTAAVVFFVWHPTPLAKAVGVTHIFLLMLAVDATLGPLLTFAVAKEGKKSLKMDLTIIVLLQLAALIYGLYSITINRPVYLAFDSHRFEVVQAADVPQASLDKANPPYQNLGWGKPQWVAVRPAKDDAEKTERTFAELQEGIAPSMQPDLYVPLETQWPAMLKESQAVATLNDINPPENVQSILAKYPKADRWLPMKAYELDMVVLINSQEKQIIDIVDLRGWK